MGRYYFYTQERYWRLMESIHMHSFTFGAKYLFLFLFGGFAYFYIEILFRGYSHFSMILCGGLAFILCGLLNESSLFDLSLPAQMLLSTGIITMLELITGCIVNRIFHWNVWDYSSLPYNFLGQICLVYSLIWLILSPVCILLDDLLRSFIFDEPHKKYHW